MKGRGKEGKGEGR